MSNKRIDFTQPGGFPLTQNTLDYMQQSYRNAIQGLADLAGNNVIVSGMEEIGGNVADGWIIWNGELMPFEGGTKQNFFFIQEVKNTELFEDGILKEVYFTKKAKFGGALPFTDLVRLDKLKVLQQNLSAFTNTLNAHIANTSNPHYVTKAQVGLGNIPNAISSDMDLDDANTLATSKAVRNSWRYMLPRVFHYGGISVAANSEEIFNVQHDANAQFCFVFGTMVSVGTNWHDDNDIEWVVRDQTANNFKLIVRNTASSGTANLGFNYALIKLKTN